MLLLSSTSSRRNTSTDVEKTRHVKFSRFLRKKHLHGRGEDSDRSRDTAVAAETPPRTWRRLRRAFRFSGIVGNTSTDVEKTELCQPVRPHIWKHLHGRGEDIKRSPPQDVDRETPPRTWRRLRRRNDVYLRGRNTSTDVEKTSASGGFCSSLWKHLHGRGEDD